MIWTLVKRTTRNGNLTSSSYRFDAPFRDEFRHGFRFDDGFRQGLHPCCLIRHEPFEKIVNGGNPKRSTVLIFKTERGSQVAAAPSFWFGRRLKPRFDDRFDEGFDKGFPHWRSLTRCVASRSLVTSMSTVSKTDMAPISIVHCGLDVEKRRQYTLCCCFRHL